MATIDNDTYAQFVKGTEYADKITNNHVKVTISAGAGNDTIDNNGCGWDDNGIFRSIRMPNYSSINGGKGNDYIGNASNDSTLLGGDGDDTIRNFSWAEIYSVEEHIGRYVFIDGGKGNDVITSTGATNVTINGGAGADSINNWGNYVTINGGDDNDTLNVMGSTTTVTAGKGSDIINIGSAGSVVDERTLESDAKNNLIKYSKGDGNDKIIGFNSTTTLQIGGGLGTYSTITKGDDIIVTVGKGKITLVGAANLDELHIDGARLLNLTDKDKAAVTLDSDIKFVNAYGRTKTVIIPGNALANSIVGGKANDLLSGGYGADTVLGGKGNDTLLGGAGNDKLFGGDGDDTLYGGTGKDSLWGGAGNDTLYGGTGNDTFIYRANEGTDRIMDYASGDMLKILKKNGKTGGKFTSSKFDGGTLTLGISGGGNVIFDNVTTSMTFNINNKSYKISGSRLVKK